MLYYFWYLVGYQFYLLDSAFDLALAGFSAGSGITFYKDTAIFCIILFLVATSILACIAVDVSASAKKAEAAKAKIS
jgi:hypothetical protein